MRQSHTQGRSPVRIAVDIGGTFTDMVMYDDTTASYRVAKVPSTPPDYSEGVIHALNQALDDFGRMAMLIHGTTAPLNAFLERKGARTALVTTKGFGDVYKMGRGNRIRMYDLHYHSPTPLVPRHLIYEVEERHDAKGNPVVPLGKEQLPDVLAFIRENDIESVGICFLHSYVNPDHEAAVAEFLRRASDTLFVTPSHEVCREWREYERTSTVAMNAYVSPILKSYLRKLTTGLEARGYEHAVYLMQSNGGLIASSEAESRGVLTLMSGPVGGSVGCKALSQQIGKPNLICIDMGGTSFDFSLIVDGEAIVTSEKKLDDLPLLAPMVDIHTIGAGGGSIAYCEADALRVGPKSAGAVPGPACYGKGGTDPTVTDANVVLGRISPEGFLGGSMRLFPDRADEAVGQLARAFALTKEQMAEGILEVVNAKMANAIRSITISKGIDPRRFSLVAFGGAGPMHAVFIAQELGISEVIVPNAAGAFSAWGMLKTDIRHDASQTYIVPLSKADWTDVEKRFTTLQDDLTHLLEAEGIPSEDMRFRRSMDMRYVGQEYFINVPVSEEIAAKSKGNEALKGLFDQLYEAQYGHKNLAEEVEIVNLRVEACGLLASKAQRASDDVAHNRDEEAGRKSETAPTRPTTFDGQSTETAFIDRARLSPRMELTGPVVIEEASCTTIVPPGYRLVVDEHGNLVICRKEKSK